MFYFNRCFCQVLSHDTTIIVHHHPHLLYRSFYHRKARPLNIYQHPKKKHNSYTFSLHNHYESAFVVSRLHSSVVQLPESEFQGDPARCYTHTARILIKRSKSKTDIFVHFRDSRSLIVSLILLWFY